jgi:hypothetical protein
MTVDKRKPWKLFYEKDRKVSGKFRATEERVQQLKDANGTWIMRNLKRAFEKAYKAIKGLGNK